MKITKAEGYKKPNYAVALAATIVAVTLSGCGSSQLEGATSLPEPPEEREVQMAGDVSVANPDEYEAEQDQMIDYDGGLAFYTDTDD